jgi:hypothetical protein
MSPFKALAVSHKCIYLRLKSSATNAASWSATPRHDADAEETSEKGRANNRLVCMAWHAELRPAEPGNSEVWGGEREAQTAWSKMSSNTKEKKIDKKTNRKRD